MRGAIFGNPQKSHSVTIDHDMTHATVSAILNSELSHYVYCHVCSCSGINQFPNLGLDGDFLISAHNIIVGNLRGKKLKVCKEDKALRAGECYPTGSWNFKKGDIIDYSWGMVGSDFGELAYAIVPASFGADS